MSSLTLQPNLFHEFHPIGGVKARRAEGDAFCCPAAAAIVSSTNIDNEMRTGLIRMRTFYQNRPKIETGT
jgi:hypothetical protein